MAYIEKLEEKLAEHIDLEEDEELDRRFAYRSETPEIDWLTLQDGDGLLQQYRARKVKQKL